MSYPFNIALHKLLQGAGGDLDLVADDIRVLLLDSSSTLLAPTTDNGGTEARDLDTLGAATTLGEYNGDCTEYTAPGSGRAVAANAVTLDDPNNRSEFDFGDLAYTNLLAGTAQCEGYLIIKFVTNIASSIPIAYIDEPQGGGQGQFPFQGNGGTVTLQIDPQGALHLQPA
jgi:hypothetical protein